MKKPLIIAAALCTVFAACHKKGSAGKSDFLTNGKWKITAETFTTTTGGQTTTEDGYAMLGACERDNLFIFGTNGHLTVDEGPTKCSPGDPQTMDNGTFMLAENDTKLVLGDSTSSYTYKIDELTMSSLKISSDTTFAGTTESIKVTFVHQ